MTANPRNIEWPQDTAGFLNGLRNEGVKAATRQMGNKGKHEALMATLRTLAKHAVARYNQQADERAEAVAAAAAESDPLGELGAVVPADTPEPDTALPAPADEAPEPVPAPEAEPDTVVEDPEPDQAADGDTVVAE